MTMPVRFNRILYYAWLEAAASLASSGSDDATLRARLDPLVAVRVGNLKNRERVLSMLGAIWGMPRNGQPQVQAPARTLYAASRSRADQLALHYGLTLVAYPFFRQTGAIVGQLGRYQPSVSLAEVRRRLRATWGQLGTIDQAAESVLNSLHDWGVLQRQTGGVYRLAVAGAQLTPDVEAWLLSCALYAHPAEELLFADLLRLPELLPFQLQLSLDQVRQAAPVAVQRQGLNRDMVRIADAPF